MAEMPDIFRHYMRGKSVGMSDFVRPTCDSSHSRPWGYSPCRSRVLNRAQPKVILLRIQPNKHTSAKDSVMAARITASTTLFEMTAGN